MLSAKARRLSVKTTLLVALFAIMLLGVSTPRADADEVDVQGSSVLVILELHGNPMSVGRPGDRVASSGLAG